MHSNGAHTIIAAALPLFPGFAAHELRVELGDPWEPTPTGGRRMTPTITARVFAVRRAPDPTKPDYDAATAATLLGGSLPTPADPIVVVLDVTHLHAHRGDRAALAQAAGLDALAERVNQLRAQGRS